MIESNNPQIDVNELMERVRREAAKIALDTETPARMPALRKSLLPKIPDLPAVPVLGLSQPAQSKRERLEKLIEKARRMIEVSPAIPKLFQGLFRRQGGFDRSILETVTSLARTSAQLQKRINELIVAAQQQNQWMQRCAEHRQTEAAWLKAASAMLADSASFAEKVTHAEKGLSQLVAELANAKSTIAEDRAELRDLQARLQPALTGMQLQVDEHETLFGSVRGELNLHGEHLQNLQAAMNGAGEHLRNLQGEAARHRQHLEALQGHAERTMEEQARMEAHLGNLEQLQQSLTRLEERQANDGVYVKGELARHSSLLQSARRGPGKAIEPASGPPLPSDPNRLDSFYLSFENRFRGPRSEIKERVRFYLPFLQEARAGAADRPILDLGCGRGEWLELLQENGLVAAGVDLNRAMIAQCEQRNLAVTEADAVAHLRSLGGKSQGAVTGFHIIEHLPLENLIDLFTEAQRVLKPGGLAIFESPNCKNLKVGACNFNIDPTHRNPVFPETAQFMLETLGFEGVELAYLSPAEDSPFTGGDENITALNELLYGSQDFAVMGRKPKVK